MYKHIDFRSLLGPDTPFSTPGCARNMRYDSGGCFFIYWPWGIYGGWVLTNFRPVFDLYMFRCLFFAFLNPKIWVQTTSGKYTRRHLNLAPPTPRPKAEKSFKNINKKVPQQSNKVNKRQTSINK